MKKIALIVVFTVTVLICFVFATDVLADPYYVYGRLGDDGFISFTKDEAEFDYLFDKMELKGMLFFDNPIKKQAIQKVNCRLSPGEKFDIVNILHKEDVVNVVGFFIGIDSKYNWYLLEDGTFATTHLFEDVDVEVGIEIEPVEIGIEVNDDFDVDYFEYGPQRKRALQKANIRSGPGMKYDIIRSLTTGDVVTAIGICDGVDCDWPWYLLKDGTYVSAHLLEDDY